MAADKAPKPAVWSDMDGTAVEIAGGKLSWLNWRNWLKYPLEGIPGYENFLVGVQEGGVEVAGLVSRRPDILPRRFVTGRSVAKLGLDRYFPDAAQRVLTGDEARKGAFVVEEARKGAPVGVVDDKPHRVGPAILDALVETPLDGEMPPITLGVVNHPQSGNYMTRFIEAARGQRYRGAGVSVTERVNDGSFAIRGRGYGFRLNVVQLAPYSMEAGYIFAQRVLGQAP